MRWDHLRRFTLRSGKDFPGFKEFFSRGVRTKYLKSVFPSESFPAWQSINTGTMFIKSKETRFALSDMSMLHFLLRCVPREAQHHRQRLLRPQRPRWRGKSEVFQPRGREDDQGRPLVEQSGARVGNGAKGRAQVHHAALGKVTKQKKH